MRTTLAYFKTRWMTRNEILHGKDRKNLTSAVTKNALLARITALYTHEENVLVQDRFPFATPIEEWPDKTTPQMKQWLRSNQPHIKICLTLAKEQNKLHTKDIQNYFMFKLQQRAYQLGQKQPKVLQTSWSMHPTLS